MNNNKTLIYSIIFFYVLTCVFSFLLGTVQEYVVDSEIMQITQLGPTLSFLLTYLIFRKSIKLYLYDNFSIDFQTLKTLVICFVITVVIFMITVAILNLNNIEVHYKNLSSLKASIFIILIGQLFGALMEEIGWRLYLQPVLQKWFSPVWVGMIVGFLWGIWHVNIFMNGITFAFFFILYAIGISIILTVLMNHIHKGEIYGAMFFHFIMNISLFLVFSDEESLFTISLLSIQFLIVGLILAIISKRIPREHDFSVH